MNDFIRVQVLQCRYHLFEVVHDLHFRESLPALYEFVECLVGADLEHDVHVLLVLEHVLELDYVLVSQRLVYLDLRD